MDLAIEQACRILQWQESLTEEEMPPEWMWLLDEDLIEHFDKVKSDREDRYGTSNRDRDDDSGLMMQNEYAKGRGRSASR